MDTSAVSICTLAVMVASVVVIFYGFYYIFQGKQKGESDLAVIQRQIRGFALLMISQIVMLLGGSLCTQLK